MGKDFNTRIISLQTNLFYGTGIPPCIVVVDTEETHTRKG
jgi:type I restriction enzyme M protein